MRHFTRAATRGARRGLATFVDARAGSETYVYRSRSARLFSRVMAVNTYYIVGGLGVSGTLVAAEYYHLRGGGASATPARARASSSSSSGGSGARMSAFLQRERESLRTALAGSGSGRVYVVVGNQASDADSIISALVLARALREGAAASSSSSSSSSSAATPLLGLETSAEDVFIPLISMKRADWSMRPETQMLMAEAGLDERACSGEALFFADDAGEDDLFGRDAAALRSLAASGQLRVVLTDHNRVDCAALTPFAEHVVAIVDHHEDRGAHSGVTGAARFVSFDAAPAVQRGVGSACTLVAQLLTAHCPALLAAEGGQLATLLAGVVLLDTVNLDPKRGKTTEDDVAALAALTKVRRGAGVPDANATAALFTRLSAAKTDPAFWSTLSIEQTLKYDLKQYNSDATGEEVSEASPLPPPYAIASSLVSIDTLEAKSEASGATLGDAMISFASTLSPTPAIIMATVLVPPTTAGDGAHRELLIVEGTTPRSTKTFEHVRDALVSSDAVLTRTYTYLLNVFLLSKLNTYEYLL